MFYSCRCLEFADDDDGTYSTMYLHASTLVNYFVLCCDLMSMDKSVCSLFS